jgi:hypothetical protein
VLLFNSSTGGNKMKQHKWHKEIKAWADGAEIEYRTYELDEVCSTWSEWKHWSNPTDVTVNFLTNEGIEYRIKPREYTYYTKVKISFKSRGIVNTEFDEMASYHSDGDNLKLTFDIRGTLIGVEVIGDDYESN